MVKASITFVLHRIASHSMRRCSCDVLLPDRHDIPTGIHAPLLHLGLALQCRMLNSRQTACMSSTTASHHRKGIIRGTSGCTREASQSFLFFQIAAWLQATLTCKTKREMAHHKDGRPPSELRSAGEEGFRVIVGLKAYRLAFSGLMTHAHAMAGILTLGMTPGRTIGALGADIAGPGMPRLRLEKAGAAVIPNLSALTRSSGCYAAWKRLHCHSKVYRSLL